MQVGIRAAFLFLVIGGCSQKRPQEAVAPAFEDDHAVVSLTREQAIDLIGQQEQVLALGELSSVSVEVAEILALQKGGLVLSGLSEVTDDVADALSAFKGTTLSLYGVQALSARSAKALAQSEDELRNQGLTLLADAAAGANEALSPLELALQASSEDGADAGGEANKQDVGNKSQLEQELAAVRMDEPKPRRLPRFPREFYCLSLGGLAALPTDVAEALASHGGSLHLDGILRISPDTAAALAEHAGYLSLDSLATLNAASAKSLARHVGGLSLNGLRTLSADTAAALKGHEGGLSLSGLTELSDDAAEALSQHIGFLNLSGLTSLSDRAAASLASHKGGLILNGRIAISEKTATMLLANPAITVTQPASNPAFP
jgi:hypothetical protein